MSATYLPEKEKTLYLAWESGPGVTQHSASVDYEVWVKISTERVRVNHVEAENASSREQEEKDNFDRRRAGKQHQSDKHAGSSSRSGKYFSSSKSASSGSKRNKDAGSTEVDVAVSAKYKGEVSAAGLGSASTEISGSVKTKVGVSHNKENESSKSLSDEKQRSDESSANASLSAENSHGVEHELREAGGRGAGSKIAATNKIKASFTYEDFVEGGWNKLPLGTVEFGQLPTQVSGNGGCWVSVKISSSDGESQWAPLNNLGMDENCKLVVNLGGGDCPFAVHLGAVDANVVLNQVESFIASQEFVRCHVGNLKSVLYEMSKNHPDQFIERFSDEFYAQGMEKFGGAFERWWDNEIKPIVPSDFRQILADWGLGEFARKFERGEWTDPAEWEDIRPKTLEKWGMTPKQKDVFQQCIVVELEKAILEKNKRVGDSPRPRVGLVLLGETGGGKTTFYQALRDHAENKPYSTKFATRRNDDQKEGQSQTKDVNVDTVLGTQYALTIIDTPGIGDTDGIDTDQEHIEGITRVLSHLEFNAICVIMKNGNNRSTQRLGYILGEIKTHMSKEVWDQLFTIVTRCPNGRLPGEDTAQVINQLGLPGPGTDRCFLVDNYAYERIAVNMKPDSAVILRKQRAYLETRDTIEEIINAASLLTQLSGESIGELRLARAKAKDLAKSLQITIDNIHSQETALYNLKDSLETIAQNKQEMTERLTRTTPIKKKAQRKMPDGKKCTICLVCENRCHDPCHLDKFGVLVGCWAFNSGKTCRTCAHEMDHHRHTNLEVYWKIVEEPMFDLQETSEALSEAKTAEEQKQAAVQMCERRLRKYELKRERIGDKLVETYFKIDELAVEDFNEYFPGYVRVLIKDLDKQQISSDERIRRKEGYERQIEMYEEKKSHWQRARELANEVVCKIKDSGRNFIKGLWHS